MIQWAWHFVQTVETRSPYGIVEGKPLGNWPVGSLRVRKRLYEDWFVWNRCEDGAWMELAKENIQLWTMVPAVLDPWVLLPQSWAKVYFCDITGTMSYPKTHRRAEITFLCTFHWMFLLHSRPVSVAESILHPCWLWSAGGDISSTKSCTWHGISAVIVWYHGTAARGRQAASTGTPTTWHRHWAGTCVKQAESICECQNQFNIIFCAIYSWFD